MSFLKLFQPTPTLSGKETNHGLRMMTLEGMASTGFTSITTSGFLAAFALALGANNLQIGILAAIPFIMQPLQIPVILLVEKLRRRKAIAVITWLMAQLLWFPMALIPVFIRSIALGEVRLRDFWQAVRKEIAIGLINGVILGALFGVIALALRGNPFIGLIAGVALGCNVLIAGVGGGTLPFLIKLLGRDPAMITGPFLTTITDITGVTIYLGLSTLFLVHILA